MIPEAYVHALQSGAVCELTIYIEADAKPLHDYDSIQLLSGQLCLLC